MKRWTVATCILLLSGCASDKSFIPSGASLTSAAHVITDSENRSGSHGAKVIYITEVDGKQTTNILLTLAPTDIYLTPGHHTIEVTYRHNGMVAEDNIQLTVKKGAEYFVHEHAVGYRIDFWVTEGKDGQIVAGAKI